MKNVNGKQGEPQRGRDLRNRLGEVIEELRPRVGYMNVAEKRHRGRVAEDGKSDGGDRAGVALGGEFAEHGMTASWAAALVAGEIKVHL